MLTAEQYARIRAIMCKYHIICDSCPFAEVTDENGNEIKCYDFQIRYPAEAVKRVHLWWLENKHRFPEYCRCEGGEEK